LHTGRIPRLGGIAIVCAFLSSLGVAALSGDVVRSVLADDAIRFAVLAGGASVLALLGLADDLWNVGARWKLLCQISVAVAAFAAGARITTVVCPGLGEMELGPLALPLTVIWIVGVVNAMNLIDGLDGLASGVSLFALAALSTNAAFAGDPVTIAILIAAAGSVLGFLPYNSHPASIFMGDAGSMFLGYLLAVSCIAAPHDPSSHVALGAPVAALALPLADLALAVGRRLLRGRSLFSADREHVHHRLLDAGVSHRMAVLILYGVSALFCGVALAGTLVGGRVVLAIVVGLCCCGAMALRRLGFLRLEVGRCFGEERRRNRARRVAVREMAHRLRGAASLPEVLDTLARMADVVSATRAEAFMPSAGLRRAFRVEHAMQGPVFCARFPFGRASFGNVELQWNDGRKRIDRDDEIALQHICACVERALRRLGPPEELLTAAAPEPVRITSRNVAARAQTG
jgi:UDP-GlcNAc:undecaprenyl-phosphate GlcNAc-1-phosphate transferase